MQVDIARHEAETAAMKDAYARSQAYGKAAQEMFALREAVLHAQLIGALVRAILAVNVLGWRKKKKKKSQRFLCVSSFTFLSPFSLSSFCLSVCFSPSPLPLWMYYIVVDPLQGPVHLLEQTLHSNTKSYEDRRKVASGASLSLTIK